MTLFSDGVTGALERALDGVSTRQHVTSHNIANAMTPGYRAQRVAFEQALSRAVARGDTTGVPLEVTDAGTPARIDGNTVVMEDEVAILTKSGLQYQALVNAMTFKLGLFHTAMR